MNALWYMGFFLKLLSLTPPFPFVSYVCVGGGVHARVQMSTCPNEYNVHCRIVVDVSVSLVHLVRLC